RHGATDTRIAADDTVDWIRSETGGFGADYTIEATGDVAVMRQAVEAAREAWGLATICGVAGKGEVLEVVPRLLITGRRVTGSSFGGVKGRTQVPQYVERWLAGEIDVESLISHRLTLDQVNHGFELMEAQDGIRSVIMFTSAGRTRGNDHRPRRHPLGRCVRQRRGGDRGVRLGRAQGRGGGRGAPTAPRDQAQDPYRLVGRIPLG